MILSWREPSMAVPPYWCFDSDLFLATGPCWQVSEVLRGPGMCHLGTIPDTAERRITRHQSQHKYKFLVIILKYGDTPASSPARRPLVSNVLKTFPSRPRVIIYFEFKNDEFWFKIRDGSCLQSGGWQKVHFKGCCLECDLCHGGAQLPWALETSVGGRKQLFTESSFRRNKNSNDSLIEAF